VSPLNYCSIFCPLPGNTELLKNPLQIEDAKLNLKPTRGSSLNYCPVNNTTFSYIPSGVADPLNNEMPYVELCTADL
jgi:hypothetical protein